MRLTAGFSRLIQRNCLILSVIVQILKNEGRAVFPEFRVFECIILALTALPKLSSRAFCTCAWLPPAWGGLSRFSTSPPKTLHPVRKNAISSNGDKAAFVFRPSFLRPPPFHRIKKRPRILRAGALHPVLPQGLRCTLILWQFLCKVNSGGTGRQKHISVKSAKAISRQRAANWWLST